MASKQIKTELFRFGLMHMWFYAVHIWQLICTTLLKALTYLNNLIILSKKELNDWKLNDTTGTIKVKSSHNLLVIWSD